MVQQKLIFSEKTNKDINVNQDELSRQLKHCEWKEYLLKDIATINPKTGELPKEFCYIDLESVQSGMLKNKKIIKSDEAPSRAQRVLQSNDILYQTVRPYQKNNLFFNFDDMEYVASTGYAQIRTNELCNPEFLYYLLHTEKFVNNVLVRCTGTSYPAINSNDLKKIKVKIPNLTIQNKIENILISIDEKIELLEKKIVLLQEFDLSIKNKIFNNLKNNSLVKLNNICLIKKGEQLNKSDMIEDGEYYVLNGGKEPSGYTNSWNVQENTITISEGGNSCGFVYFNSEKFYCGGHCYYLTLTQEDFDLNYLFNYLKYIEPKIMRLRVGSGLPNIQKGDIENINILKLNYNNQKEIGRFFDLINQKISLTLKEKEELEIFKKGLLQKMFV